MVEMSNYLINLTNHELESYELESVYLQRVLTNYTGWFIGITGGPTR